MKFKQNPARGFTLAEIIVSALLVSIFAIGTFKSSHFAQLAASRNLTQTLDLNQQRQIWIIRKLKSDFTQIHVDSAFPALKCLVEDRHALPTRQQQDCIEAGR